VPPFKNFYPVKPFLHVGIMGELVADLIPAYVADPSRSTLSITMSPPSLEGPSPPPDNHHVECLGRLILLDKLPHKPLPSNLNLTTQTHHPTIEPQSDPPLFPEGSPKIGEKEKRGILWVA
jgi:hypothetical protein